MGRNRRPPIVSAHHSQRGALHPPESRPLRPGSYWPGALSPRALRLPPCSLFICFGIKPNGQRPPGPSPPAGMRPLLRHRAPGPLPPGGPARAPGLGWPPPFPDFPRPCAFSAAGKRRGKCGVFGRVLALGFFWVERAGGKPPAAIPKEEMRRGALVISSGMEPGIGGRNSPA